MVRRITKEVLAETEVHVETRSGVRTEIETVAHVEIGTGVRTEIETEAHVETTDHGETGSNIEIGTDTLARMVDVAHLVETETAHVGVGNKAQSGTQIEARMESETRSLTESKVPVLSKRKTRKPTGV